VGRRRWRSSYTDKCSSAVGAGRGTPAAPARRLAFGLKGENKQNLDSLDPNPNPNPNYVFIPGISYPWDEYRVGQSLLVCART